MKKSNKWEKIAKAKGILSLGDTATINQIKQAYRELAKAHHPDTASPEEAASPIDMQELNDAYRVLLEYCENHAIPLERSNDVVDDEDWWMDRFGNDPLWGKRKD